MNPFKLIKGLFIERTLQDYRGKYRYEMPPHVFALGKYLLPLNRIFFVRTRFGFILFCLKMTHLDESVLLTSAISADDMYRTMLADEENQCVIIRYVFFINTEVTLANIYINPVVNPVQGKLKLPNLLCK